MRKFSASAVLLLLVSLACCPAYAAPRPAGLVAGGCNYDMNDAAFIQTKKTLIRLAMMASDPVDVNPWMPVATTENIQMVIRNKYNLSQFWNGELQQAMPPEMQEVFKTGKSLTLQKTPECSRCRRQ